MKENSKMAIRKEKVKHSDIIGKLVWKDGKVYEGEFSDNMIHGKGKLTKVDGSSYEGNYYLIY